MTASIAQVEIAARAWVIAMRKLWMKRHGLSGCPIRAWEDYTTEDQQVMLTAARVALAAAEREGAAA